MRQWDKRTIPEPIMKYVYIGKIEQMSLISDGIKLSILFSAIIMIKDRQCKQARNYFEEAAPNIFSKLRAWVELFSFNFLNSFQASIREGEKNIDSLKRKSFTHSIVPRRLFHYVLWLFLVTDERHKHGEVMETNAKQRKK